MAELPELFHQQPRESARFLNLLLRVGTASHIASTFPMLDTIKSSYDPDVLQSSAVWYLRVWLYGLLALQLVQLPLRVLILRTLHLISRIHQREAITANLFGTVDTMAWKLNEKSGYIVYVWFLFGVYLSWYFGADGTAPENLKICVLCCALGVVIRMVFCFISFFYLFMYTDEIPGVPNPRGATHEMMSRVVRFEWDVNSEMAKKRKRASTISSAASSGVSPIQTPLCTPVLTPMCSPVGSPCTSTHTTPSNSPRLPVRRLGGLQSAPPSPRGRQASVFDFKIRRRTRRQAGPELLARAAAAVAAARRRNPLSPKWRKPRPAEATPDTSGDEDGEEPCPICLCTFEDGDDMAQLPCHANHLFHFGCIKLWFKQSTSCPLCAGDLGEVDADSDDDMPGAAVIHT